MLHRIKTIHNVNVINYTACRSNIHSFYLNTHFYFLANSNCNLFKRQCWVSLKRTGTLCTIKYNIYKYTHILTGHFSSYSVVLDHTLVTTTTTLWRTITPGFRSLFQPMCCEWYTSVVWAHCQCCWWPRDQYLYVYERGRQAHTHTHTCTYYVDMWVCR